MQRVVIQKRRIHIYFLLRCHCCFDQYFALLHISRCGVWPYSVVSLSRRFLRQLLWPSFLQLTDLYWVFLNTSLVNAKAQMRDNIIVYVKTDWILSSRIRV